MTTILPIALLLGLTTGVLLIIASRRRLAWLGWVALSPLCAAVFISPPPIAGLAGLVAGGLAIASAARGRFPAIPGFEAANIVFFGLLWATTCAIAAWLWPDDAPAWGAVIFTAATVVFAGLPEVLSGRIANLLLPSQVAALPVVHIARVGHSLVVSALLGLAATVPTMLLVELPPSREAMFSALAASVGAAAAMIFGFAGYRAAVRSADKSAPLRVAAVSVDGDTSDGGIFKAKAYRDVPGTVGRYAPHVAAAIARGARLVVLPEIAVVVTAGTRAEWLGTVACWARDGEVAFVVGVFDADQERNQVVIFDETGRLATTYDKQHPVPRGVEPRRKDRMPPARASSNIGPLSAVICYDLDFADWVQPVRLARGILAVPASDWREIDEDHHSVSVWAPVIARVPMVRSTGQGTSSIYDAAGVFSPARRLSPDRWFWSPTYRPRHAKSLNSSRHRRRDRSSIPRARQVRLTG